MLKHLKKHYYNLPLKTGIRRNQCNLIEIEDVNILNVFIFNTWYVLHNCA